MAALAAPAASRQSIENLIARLDSMIANENSFRDAKLRKIDEIKKHRQEGAYSRGTLLEQ